MLTYYKLQKCEEDRLKYHANQGLFNFWNEYLILHWKDSNILIINKPHRQFNKVYSLTIGEAVEAYQCVIDNFCPTENNGENCEISKSNMCEIVNDFGICVKEDLKRVVAWCKRLMKRGVSPDASYTEMLDTQQ